MCTLYIGDYAWNCIRMRVRSQRQHLSRFRRDAANMAVNFYASCDGSLSPKLMRATTLSAVNSTASEHVVCGCSNGLIRTGSWRLEKRWRVAHNVLCNILIWLRVSCLLTDSLACVNAHVLWRPAVIFIANKKIHRYFFRQCISAFSSSSIPCANSMTSSLAQIDTLLRFYIRFKRMFNQECQTNCYRKLCDFRS